MKFLFDGQPAFVLKLPGAWVLGLTRIRQAKPLPTWHLNAFYEGRP